MSYEYEPETFEYKGATYSVKCEECGSKRCVQRRTYTPDLRINDFWVEIKGKFTAQNRRLMGDFLRTGPKIDLRFIFQRDNWTTAKHTQRYSDWATKHGCKWHVGESIPVGWA